MIVNQLTIFAVVTKRTLLQSISITLGKCETEKLCDLAKRGFFWARLILQSKDRLKV
jgi:hypothetical protein